MRTNSGGYILVVADRRSALMGLRVRVSRRPGAQWLARARRLVRRGRLLPPGLRLIGSHYAEDPARVRADLAAALGSRFAAQGRAGEGRLRRALSAALAEDRVRREARFDPVTGLFRTPGDALPRPVKRLVARLAAEIVARTPGRRRIPAEDLCRAYALGLVWPLLGAQLAAHGLPLLYRAEAWRALVRALAGRHLTDAETENVLKAAAGDDAEFRVGAWEFRRFARRQAGGALPGLDRFAFYLGDPRDHMGRGLADYRRRVHGAAAVRLATWTFRVVQIAAFGAAAAGALWLLLRVDGGLMPGLTLLFALGAAIPAGRLYRRPDMARLMGHVSERALAGLATALAAEAPPARPAENASAEIAPAEREAEPPQETQQPEQPEQAQKPEEKAAPPAAAAQPADIPAPVVPAPQTAAIPAPEPAPPALAAAETEVAREPAAEPPAVAAREAAPEPAPEAAPESAPVAPAAEAAPTPADPLYADPAVLTAADVARAYMAMPIGPIPFPVPGTPETETSPIEARPREAASAGPEAEPVRAEPAPAQAPAPEAPSAGAVVRNEGAEGIFVLGWGMPIPVPNWMAADLPDAPSAAAAAAVVSGAQTGDAEAAIREARIFHATPLPPVLPSAAFWGVEGAGLQPGAEPRSGGGDGSRHGNS